MVSLGAGNEASLSRDIHPRLCLILDDLRLIQVHGELFDDVMLRYGALQGEIVEA